MAYTVEKKLSLSFLGGGWSEDTYLQFTGITFAETRELGKLNVTNDGSASDESLDLVLGLLAKHYISGMGWNGSEVVKIPKEDLQELPSEVITKAIELLVGAPDPKSSVK
jgi:hypothetical protein